MEVIGLLILLLLVFFVFPSFLGKPSFWKATRKNPGEAWTFFTTHSEWYLEDKPTNINVVGPFRIVNPHNGSLVKLYCDASKIEGSQEEFLGLISKS